MANIMGRYEFHRACSSQGMAIFQLSDSGDLVEAVIDQAGIHGSYIEATNAISFNDAPVPGDTLLTTFYSGYVIPDGNGGVCAMAGTFHEMTINQHPFSLTSRQGSWYATYQGPIIP